MTKKAKKAAVSVRKKKAAKPANKKKAQKAKKKVASSEFESNDVLPGEPVFDVVSNDPLPPPGDPFEYGSQLVQELRGSTHSNAINKENPDDKKAKKAAVSAGKKKATSPVKKKKAQKAKKNVAPRKVKSNDPLPGGDPFEH